MDEVAGAIADPVRRRILETLRDGPVAAGRIAAGFEISRPAISRHLRVLRESGLVRDTLVGRERHYELDTSVLEELRAWIDGLAESRGPAVWERRFDALETEVYRTRRERRRGEHQPVRDEESA
ncbi:metalloregulator ArsR/SmtB family transcription factor [Dactylosporangium sp. CS-033363]|uniref:metalloregulator ArsR/SmtB family transcription factor n=1 Tax=Dactylosporangium sp. CS-033363 TaxID=3239935 RepID=UPI003D94780C